jgi:hypothetical protein
MGLIDISAGGLLISMSSEGQIAKFVALVLLAKGVWTILKTISEW